MKVRRAARLCSFLLVMTFVGVQSPIALSAQHVRPPAPHQIDQRQKLDDHWGATEWGAFFTGGLLLVACGALTFALFQVRAARRQTNVMVLFELEHRWNSDPVIEGREELSNIFQKVSDLIDDKYPNATNEERKERIKQGISICLYIARKYDKKSYRPIQSTLEFYEAMGVFIFVLKGLDLDSVAHLFAGAIEHVDYITRRYIEQWRKKDAGAFEHAVRLFDETHEWLKIERALAAQRSAKPR